MQLYKALQCLPSGGNQLCLLQVVSAAQDPVHLLQELPSAGHQVSVLQYLPPAILCLLQELQEARLWSLLYKVSPEEDDL